MIKLKELTPIELQAVAVAIAEAKKGQREGGIPIGASIIKEDEIVGSGHNQRVQKNSQILHGEMAGLANAGAGDYRGATMVTTLFPCPMCAATIGFFGFAKVIVGEMRTFWHPVSTRILEDFNVEVVVLDLPECKEMMDEFIAKNPKLWDQDIGK